MSINEEEERGRKLLRNACVLSQSSQEPHGKYHQPHFTDEKTDT